MNEHSTTERKSKPTESLNANQFEDDGLPGIDKNYPPERPWAVEDPAGDPTVVEAGSETRDDLATRRAREQPDIVIPNDPETAPMVSDQGDPQSSPTDDEKQAVAQSGKPDPDAEISPEQRAMHMVEPSESA